MENSIPKKRMDQMLAEVLTKNLPDMRTLLVNNGVVGADSFNDKDTQIAVLKALKDSASFRSDLAAFMASLVQSKATFVKQPQLNVIGLADADEAEAASATSTSTKSKGSFWDTLGGLATKDNLQSLFNTGLGVASNSMQNKANKASEERALELERLRLQQIQAQTDLAKNGGAAKSGMSTGAIIGIVVGSLVLVTVLVLVLKKKK